MEIAWVIAGKGAGSAEVDNIDGAVAALTERLRADYGPDGPEVLARVLTDVWGPLRHRVVTEGEQAIKQADSWSGHSAGLLVTLLP